MNACPSRVLLLALWACQPSGTPSECQVYRPQAAKATYDGRVGGVVVRNASPHAVEVKVYHPDGLGDVERRWTVPAGVISALRGPDQQPLSVGNDWGIQVARSCVLTLGQAAAWHSAEFSLTWTGADLQPGLDPAEERQPGEPQN